MKNLISTIKNSTNNTVNEFRSFKTQMEENAQSLREDIHNLRNELQSIQNDTAQKLDSLEYNTQRNSHQRDHVNTNNSLVSFNTTTNPVSTFPPAATYTCGNESGWRRAVYLNMTDPNATCPTGWQVTAYSKRTCGRVSTGKYSCDSAFFPVTGGEYSKVCGRILAYQAGSTRAFESSLNHVIQTINSAYVDGVSVTYGIPREHIWTFASGWVNYRTPHSHHFNSVCPCAINRMINIPYGIVPGQDFFCESAIRKPHMDAADYTVHYSDPLWDAKNCYGQCCNLRSPYFIKKLKNPTTNHIEARICLSKSYLYSNIAVELIELYAK